MVTCFLFLFSQTARPVLFDQQLVDQMIEDLEKVDLGSIGSQAMLSVTQDDTDSELNAECKHLPSFFPHTRASSGDSIRPVIKRRQ